MAHKAKDRFRLNDAAYQFTSGEYAGIKTASCSSFLYFFIVLSLDKHIYLSIILFQVKYSQNNTALIVVPPFRPFVCNLVKVTVFTTYVEVLIWCHAFGIFPTLHAYVQFTCKIHVPCDGFIQYTCEVLTEYFSNWWLVISYYHFLPTQILWLHVAP